MQSLKYFSILLTSGIFLFGCSYNSQMIERKDYHTWENRIGYSQVVKVNNMLYISGITSEKENMEGQLNEVYSSIKNILSDYGVGTDAIIKETIFTTDIEGLKNAIPVRKAHFNNKYPSSSWVEVRRLWDPINLIEIEVVAVLP